jgi:hypothetical protein
VSRAAVSALMMASLCATSPAFADCTIERAIYRDLEGVASVEFLPTDGAAAVTNRFRMLLDNDVVLDGIVMWSEGVARPYGMLTRYCPEGDVTGAEIAACTMWEGVIYSSDDFGNVELLPPEAAGAPAKLVFSDLGPALRHSAAWGENGFSKVPWDVFKLSGCQE